MTNINRTTIDEAIENLNGIFNETSEVLKNYEAEKKALEERGTFLADRLVSLQEEHTQAMLEREGVKDKPSDYINLSQKLSKIDEEVRVLNSLQEQLNEEYGELKERYLMVIREAYSKDKTAVRNTFNVNEWVRSIRDELKQAISDYEKEIYIQDRQVMPVIDQEFLGDTDLMNESWDNPTRRNRTLAFNRTFQFDRFKLYYDKELKL